MISLFTPAYCLSVVASRQILKFLNRQPIVIEAIRKNSIVRVVFDIEGGLGVSFAYEKYTR